MTTLQRLLDPLGNAIGRWLPDDDCSPRMHSAIDPAPASTMTASGTCTPRGTGRRC